MTVIDKLRTALNERYRIDREIGVGGMATVYLAHDLRHDRDVAIKVLHPDLAAALGAERFLAEIKTTAKLQHPHILPLLDSGEADGLLYYVMPYVSGESLRNRIERETQLAVDDAVRIAREVLSALESAHKQHVIHRDIKPENILLHEDQALVADFGIALAVSAAGGPRMTQTGLSLGTPAYMAPEQAMGERVIDGRADIYALGAVLYEMLVGEAPFTGPSVQAIVARVMTESPRPVTGQRRSVPEHVNAAVLRALEKLPADRFHSAQEFSNALANPSFSVRDAAETRAAKQSRKLDIRRVAVIPWAIAAVATAAAIFFGVRANRGSSDEATFVSLDMPTDMQMPPGATEVLAISDDGKIIAIGGTLNGKAALALRRLDRSDATIVQGSDGARGGAAFSADGKWLAFNAQGKVWKVATAGGPPTAIASSNWAHMSWVGNEAVVFTKTYSLGLYRISADGRDSAVLTVPDKKKGELGHWWPQTLPDGKHVLFTNYTTPADKSKIEVLSLADRKRQVVLEGGYFGRYVQGHLVFVRNGVVATVPFDLGKLRTGATPVSLPLDIEVSPPNGWAGLAVAPNGTMVYRTDPFKNVSLTWSDEIGNEEPAVDSVARYSDAIASPDGKKIAVVREGDVWIYDRQRALYTRLTDTEQIETSIVWSPDNRFVYYMRDVPQYDIFRRAADGGSQEELVATSGNDKHISSISPDGTTMFYDTDAGADDDIFAAPTTPRAESKPLAIIQGTGSQENAVFSPDGAWFTYSSNESGRTEVYLAPYPVNRGGTRQQVSIGGGDYAYWSPDGRSIYYIFSGKIMKVAVEPRWGNIGRPEALNRIQPILGYTVGPDGRFLISRTGKGAERHSVKLIINWPATLKDAANR
jgi:serine/threonine-protein kinase